MIVILLPAYNEEESLPPLMSKLRTALTNFGEEFKIIVCNDGSRDKTQELLEEYARVFLLKLFSIRLTVDWERLHETSLSGPVRLLNRVMSLCVRL